MERLTEKQYKLKEIEEEISIMTNKQMMEIKGVDDEAVQDIVCELFEMSFDDEGNLIE